MFLGTKLEAKMGILRYSMPERSLGLVEFPKVWIDDRAFFGVRFLICSIEPGGYGFSVVVHGVKEVMKVGFQPWKEKDDLASRLQALLGPKPVIQPVNSMLAVGIKLVL
jgi:hypothetical protein